MRPDSRDLNFLLIRRVERVGDPWSGQIAFPGGHVEPGDPSEFDTARRETLEEVSVDISAHEILGRLDDVQPSNLAVTVTPFVVAVMRGVTPTPGSEVAECLWVSFEYLQHPVKREFVVQRSGKSVSYEGYEIRGRILWGMTLRMIKDMVSRIESQLS